MPDFNLEIVIDAYKSGLFPMAESRNSEDFHWYDPLFRGQLPIETLHIPKKLQRTLVQYPYQIKVNTRFKATIEGCAAQAEDRPETWINQGIKALFIALHQKGYAHSIEAWDDGKLVGGLYGLAIGGLFCGESMFSRARDASKICLIHLCARLWHGGFTVLDTQFINDHLLQFGAYEIPRQDYLNRIEKAVALKANFLSQKTEQELLTQYLENRQL